MITCEICKRELKLITYHHLKAHGITLIEYKRNYPDAKCISDDLREHCSLRMMGNTNLLGYKHTDETKRRIGLAGIGNKSNTGRHLSVEHKLAIKNGMNDECRARMRASRKKWLDSNNGRIPIEQQKKISASLRLRSKDPTYRKKLSEGKRRLWQRPEYRQNCVSAVMRAVRIQPNKPEQKMASILGLFWQYTGDGGLVIDGRVPDFWNGNHKVIEIFGDYWHRGENPQDRIDCFKKHGYDCLVIWEHELENIKVVRKRIMEFTLL